MYRCFTPDFMQIPRAWLLSSLYHSNNEINNKKLPEIEVCFQVTWPLENQNNTMSGSQRRRKNEQNYCVTPWPLVHSFSDCSDGACGGGGLLHLLAPSSRGAPLGGVWDLPSEPGVLCVACGCPLSGVQQLVCQPGHLRFPVRELQESLQASVQMPDRYERLPP